MREGELSGGRLEEDGKERESENKDSVISVKEFPPTQTSFAAL